MKRDEFTGYDEAISALVFWWNYEKGWLPVAGYPTECPSTMGYRTSRQYDWDMSPNVNEELVEPTAEVDFRGRQAIRVGNIVDNLAEPYRSALYILARNKATGVSVWRSNRLPEEETARAQIVCDALDLFVERFSA